MEYTSSKNPWGDFTRDSDWVKGLVGADSKAVFHTVPWAPGMQTHQMTAAVYRELFARCAAIRAMCEATNSDLAELRWFLTLKVLAREIRYESALLVLALGMLEEPVFGWVHPK